jgi:hypothetical protein
LAPVLEDHVKRPGGLDGGVTQAGGKGGQVEAVLSGGLDGRVSAGINGYMSGVILPTSLPRAIPCQAIAFFRQTAAAQPQCRAGHRTRYFPGLAQHSVMRGHNPTVSASRCEVNMRGHIKQKES